MKKQSFVVLGAALAMPAFAEDVNESLDADPDGEVVIFNTAGKVDVIGWSRDSVEVTGTLGDDVEELKFERDGDEIIIKVKVPKRIFGKKDVNSRLTIHVPEDSDIDVATISASIDVRDVHGEQELQAISGRIQTQAYDHDVSAETVSGRIIVEGDNEEIDVELGTVSGSISAENIAGDIEAESVSGGISVSGGMFDNVDMESVNGRITFSGGLEDNGDMHMEAVNGSLNVDINGKVPATYDIETFNGGIKNCFGVKPERTSRYAPGLKLSHTEGKGTASVTMETLNGSINVCAK